MELLLRYHGSVLRRVLLAAVAVALAVAYAPVVRGMAQQWATDEDMGHGFLVPLAVAWIVWRERARWMTLSPAPDLRGLTVMLLGAAIHIASAVGGGLFMGAAGLLVSIAGAVWTLGGTAYLRVWAWPLLLLLFALPKLAVVYNQATLPLQLASSRMAAGALALAGVTATVHGNIVQVAHYQVAVEEACNGVRYLLSLGFLGTLFAYYFDPRAWMRAALLAAAVPLAVGANVARIAATALLGSINPAFGEGFLHYLSGVAVFALCLPALAGLRVLIDRVYARITV